jgi:hypothetical protein
LIEREAQTHEGNSAVDEARLTVKFKAERPEEFYRQIYGQIHSLGAIDPNSLPLNRLLHW